MSIKSDVCRTKGHAITALVVGETQIPGTAVWAKKYEVLCEQCGTTLEDIRKESRSRSGTPRAARKPKDVTQPQAESQVEVHQ
jgi:hypothetical protein